MAERHYFFETFEGSSKDWDSRFTNFLNSKFDSGFKYKECFFSWEGDKRSAQCVFKRR